jgi:hypothetical protein
MFHLRQAWQKDQRALTRTDDHREVAPPGICPLS